MVVDRIVAMVAFFIAGPLLHRVSECVFSFTSELNAADEGPARSSYLNQHSRPASPARRSDFEKTDCVMQTVGRIDEFSVLRHTHFGSEVCAHEPGAQS